MSRRARTCPPIIYNLGEKNRCELYLGARSSDFSPQNTCIKMPILSTLIKYFSSGSQTRLDRFRPDWTKQPDSVVIEFHLDETSEENPSQNRDIQKRTMALPI